MRRNSLSNPSFGYACVCTGVLLLCVVLIRPVLESGLTDDWSTVRTAQLLAQTGHIQYNGWEAAILGWPLYVAALFIKLFGPSFTSVRASDLLESVATVLLLHYTFWRAGLTPRNAAFGVLAVVLTPMYLLASVVFMTDIPGLLALVVCLYTCLRALQARTQARAAGWIAFAALSNAVLGTSRQIAWLGVLVMVPCAIWLLRRVRPAVLTGVLCCLVSYGFLAACMHWFNHQPYILIAPLLPQPPIRINASKVVAVCLRIFLDLNLWLLPVALAFLVSLRRGTRRTWISLAFLALAGAGLAVLLVHLNALRHWLSPFLIFPYVHPQTIENTFTMTTMPVKGPAPDPLPTLPRLVLSWLALGSLAALVAGLTSRPRTRFKDAAGTASMRQLLWLILPLTLVYLGFLISRGSYNFVYDRYLLPILPLLFLLLLRYHQAHEQVRLPVWCAIPVAVMGLYSVVTLHDCFESYRGALAACNEIAAAGFPRTAIDGGWEYNHYTQIVVGTYVHQAGVRLPNGTLVPDLDTNSQTDCSMDVRDWTPDLHPLFTLGYPGTPCELLPAFAPVHVHTWLPPRDRTIEVFRYSLEGPRKPQATEK